MNGNRGKESRRGTVTVAGEEWSVASEAAGRELAEPEKAPNKANWNWPLITGDQVINVDRLGVVYAKQSSRQESSGEEDEY
jgi:hypothetical protein